MNGIKKDTAGLYHFLPAPAAQTYLIKHFMFAYQWGGRKAQEPTVSLRMAATSFSKIHFGLGLAHTPQPPNTVVGDPQLSLINTPHAQMVAQQQTKPLRKSCHFLTCSDGSATANKTVKESCHLSTSSLSLTSSSGLLILSSGRP